MNRKKGNMLSEQERQFLARCRVAHFSTADRHAVPHVVPVCFAVRGGTLYTAIDEKPKCRPSTMLKGLQNIAENAMVAVVADRYDDGWTRLGWVMLRGRADILKHGGAQ